MKPYLTDETLKDERIILTENEKVASDERERVKSLMDTFQILYQTYCTALQILPFNMTRCKKIKMKIENHPKILEIKKKFRLM